MKKRLNLDYSLFTRGSGMSIIALVYVDDILLTNPCSTEIESVKGVFHSHFLLKDLGYAKYFLALEISCSKDGIYLSQRKYCLRILEDTGFSCKARQTSYDSQSKSFQRGGCTVIFRYRYYL